MSLLTELDWPVDVKAAHFYDAGGMAWTTRQYTKEQIDKAGDALIALSSSDAGRSEAIKVINNWRSCHSYPLQVIKMTLLDRAKKVDVNALIAQRIKRLPSIALKLEHNTNMRLSQMQDIGGCRAVLNKIAGVDKLVQVYEQAPMRKGRPALKKVTDYIAKPKDDGYRSVHLIMKYESESPAQSEFGGQKIEVQIRSKLQHAWATAVETAQTFTGQALKSKIKSAKDSWLRFFALMSSSIAAKEKRPLVPNTPTDKDSRVEELRAIEKAEQIVLLLRGWKTAVEHSVSRLDKIAYAFLLILNTAKRILQIIPYIKEQLPSAEDRYAQEEAKNDPNQQIVLVSVESMTALQKAYPNYYADTSVFIDAVRQEIGD